MILILPFGDPGEDALDASAKAIRKAYSKRAVVGESLPEPDFARNQARSQFLSTAVINRIMDDRRYDGFERVLAVVEGDIYAEGLNFVFGEAGSRAAVISVARLRQGFYGLPEDKAIFEKRVATETVHELGHTYGLGHCKEDRCVMFFSNTIEDTDRKSAGFCGRCLRRLAAHGFLRS